MLGDGCTQNSTSSEQLDEYVVFDSESPEVEINGVKREPTIKEELLG